MGQPIGSPISASPECFSFTHFGEFLIIYTNARTNSSPILTGCSIEDKY
ncbi:MAG: hypothetical protein ABIK61_04805 [candidate division WOR-3 bacterium]